MEQGSRMAPKLQNGQRMVRDLGGMTGKVFGVSGAHTDVGRGNGLVVGHGLVRYMRESQIQLPERLVKK